MKFQKLSLSFLLWLALRIVEEASGIKVGENGFGFNKSKFARCLLFILAIVPSLIWLPFGIGISLVMLSFLIWAYISFHIGSAFGTNMSEIKIAHKTKPVPVAFFIYATWGALGKLSVVLALMPIYTLFALMLAGLYLEVLAAWVYQVILGANILSLLWWGFFMAALWPRYGFFITNSGHVYATKPKMGWMITTEVQKIQVASIIQSNDSIFWNFYWKYDPAIYSQNGDSFVAYFVPVSFVEKIEAFKTEWKAKNELANNSIGFLFPSQKVGQPNRGTAQILENLFSNV